MSTQDTLALMKSALSGMQFDTVNKTVSQATGLTAYDLQAPAKNLYPVMTPVRNKMPRIGGGTGPATNWREIRAILGSGFDAMGWVPEGQRSGRMSYQATPKSASYVTIGEEDAVTFEAEHAAEGFENIMSTASMRVLQKMMLKEENAILWGNFDAIALGTPTTPTLSASGSGATLPAATYSVGVVALTYEGFQQASLAGGIPLSQTITGADGQTYVLNGGSSVKSSLATQAVTLGQTLFCSTPVIPGAAAYAWFGGTAGNEKLVAITTINSFAATAALSTSGMTYASVTAGDKSQNTLAFNGLLPVAMKSGSGAYIAHLATGTAGTGTKLTASGRGTCTEIDLMFRTMWDQYKLSPTVLYVNAQEIDTLSKLALAGPANSSLLQIQAAPQGGFASMVMGGVVGWYFNPFTANGGSKVPIFIHPSQPPGMVFGYCEDLPLQYQSNNVPQVAAVKTRRDYYQMNWPLRTRMNEFGVYAEEVLAIYVPFAIGVIDNIAPGVG